MAEKEETYYLPYVVYQNISKFLDSRKLDLVAGAQYYETKKSIAKSANFLALEEFTKNIQYYGYVQIEAKDGEAKDRRFRKEISATNRSRHVKTFLLLLDENSVYAKTTQQFAKLLERISGFLDEHRDFSLDIYVISKDDLSLHLKKKILSYLSDGDSKSGFRHITSYKYSMFSSNILENKFVPEHRILPKPKEKDILTRLMCQKIDLKKIRKIDPPVAWLGGEVGDIIEVDAISEATGVSKDYHVVRL